MVTAVRMEYIHYFFGGRFDRSSGDARIEVVLPHTGEVIGSVPSATTSDVDRAVALARAAFDSTDWPLLDPDRAGRGPSAPLAADAKRTEEMAELVTAELGCRARFAELARGPGGAAMLATFLDAADALEWEVPGEGHNAGTLVRREPVGVVGAITPWNVPQSVIMPKLAPALLAGCTVVVKAAPESTA